MTPVTTTETAQAARQVATAVEHLQNYAIELHGCYRAAVNAQKAYAAGKARSQANPGVHPPPGQAAAAAYALDGLKNAAYLAQAQIRSAQPAVELLERRRKQGKTVPTDATVVQNIGLLLNAYVDAEQHVQRALQRCCPGAEAATLAASLAPESESDPSAKGNSITD